MSSIEDEAKTMLWLEEVLGKHAETSSLVTELEDGVVLCDLASKVLSIEMKGVHRGSKIPPFKRRENIKLFLTTAKKAGLLDHELFETIDLEGTRDAVTDKIVTNAESVARCLSRFSRLGESRGIPLLQLTTSNSSGKLQGFQQVEYSKAIPLETSEPAPKNARGARGHKPRGSFVRIAQEEEAKSKQSTTISQPAPQNQQQSKPQLEKEEETVVTNLQKREDLKPPPVAFCKERCVVFWPKQKQGDERFDEIVNGLPDKDFQDEVRALCVPGTKVKIEYKPKSGCIVTSEDEEGNCMQMDLDWDV
uniref:Calponin-homology (CH) domain-containing protein n=1 Tax=Aureoumbra lagunensis TaxID=44058 RepID=A0A7S3K517_9STRA|mmetsp:Transcript_4165/g.5849  ORF Transcript_4165/g.5849 Transcript_4165/m.5849 type:complete len:306 (+) Transcript_4165:234-1151(+)|eukprot:CAMPEP_0197303030 /NCGR_PEP_ID=MMETSP0890-20130614/51418_1 /TAXON_ID=44058 ORGANISM="Aureoumbra lagunensis, Strain CCMP1510" /NCGR_SAMPLE_ID=MMETSP0890 /ASSEMBLY_ACC=CAM_ASM_000533 /LENGTH=305 /DNA_ID=CAMNT_0042782777 /DNA_START=157 /DNA_END=1074 /DNA_ORIENTATION=+